MTEERILIVEEEPVLRNQISLTLRRQGYQVEQAEDGVGALDILGAQPAFSLMICAFRLRGMGGKELLRAVRKLDAQLALVMLIAPEDIDTATELLRAEEAYDILLKPLVSLNQMIVTSERAIAHRRLTLECQTLKARLQRESELLRVLCAHSGDAILSANSAGVLQIANPAAARLIGTDNAEGSLAQSCLPPALASLIANWQTVGGGQPTVIEMPWPDGSVQIITLTPLHEPGSSTSGWSAVLRDISHVKHLEERKTQMLAETAAVLRAPLSQAMNLLVELHILTNQNERVSQVVYRLTQTWKQMQAWGDDLSALLQIDANPAVQCTSLALAPIFQELARSQCEPAEKSSDLRFDIQIDPNLPEIIANPDLLRRLLYGLINRAVRRSQPGCAIQLHARSHNNQVWISVSDDGPAVNDTELPHLFERNFIKDHPATRINGLEMALVKTITERMQGQIWVGGQDKMGSSISVCLPAQMQPSLG